MTDPRLLRLRAELAMELQKDEVSRKYGYCQTLLWRALRSDALHRHLNVDPRQGLNLIEEILALTLGQQGRSIYRTNFLAELESIRKRLVSAAEERKRTEGLSKRVPRPPAKLALVLYLLMEDADADAAAGDLEQRFPERIKRLGERGARIWYAKQIGTSVWPLLWAAGQRVLKPAVGSVLSIVLRTVGLGSVADELKRVAGVQRRRAGIVGGGRLEVDMRSGQALDKSPRESR